MAICKKFVLVGFPSTVRCKTSRSFQAKKFKNHRNSLLYKILSRNARKTLPIPNNRTKSPRSKPRFLTEETPSIPKNPKNEQHDGPVQREDVMDNTPTPVRVHEVDMNLTQPAYNNDVVMFYVILKSSQPDDVGVMYDIRSDETFEAIFKDYAEKLDVKTSRIRVYKNDDHIPEWAKPIEVGVESGDLLTVVGLAGVINTNTRIKRFYIRNTGHRFKKKLQVSSKLDTPMCRLFHWAHEINADPTTLLVMHEDNVISTEQTIRVVGIKNGDKVRVLPNFVR